MKKNENIETQQSPTPNIEKVSVGEIKQAKTLDNSNSKNSSVYKLIEAMKALSADTVSQAKAYVDKKIDILNKLK